MSEWIKPDSVGALRHRISIRQYSASRNSAGEEILTWSELAEVWANVEHKTAGSQEEEKANRVTAQLSADITIRYRSDINEKMRVLYDSKLWNILSIVPDRYQTYLTLECEHYIT